MEKWIEKEVYRLVDPNSYPTRQDADKFLSKLENFIKGEVIVKTNKKLKELGIEILKVAGENYYGRNWTDEMVYGVGYLETFGKKDCYALKLKEDWDDEEWFIDVLIYGKTITGKGSRHYRYFIEELIDKRQRIL